MRFGFSRNLVSVRMLNLIFQFCQQLLDFNSFRLSLLLLERTSLSFNASTFLNVAYLEQFGRYLRI